MGKTVYKRSLWLWFRRYALWYNKPRKICNDTTLFILTILDARRDPRLAHLERTSQTITYSLPYEKNNFRT